ncbi:MAG: inositol monophosphatase family protein [Propionibacteriaceae bacterium]
MTEPKQVAGVDLAAAAALAQLAARRAMAITRETPLGAVAAKANAADVVTEVDTAVERAVRELIADRFPDHAVVGEEYGGRPTAGPTWYCDPVDGTTNLAAGLPWTSFSLSLAVGATPLVAVVADPWRDEVLHAVAGGGCYLDDRLVLAPGQRRHQTLTGGVVLTEWARHQPWPGMLPLLAALADRLCTTRIMGSSTLTLASVAAGRATAAVVGEFQPEDHLAATLLAHEAGLTVWDEDGAPTLFPARGGVMVAHPAVAAELHAVWRDARGAGSSQK